MPKDNLIPFKYVDIEMYPEELTYKYIDVEFLDDFGLFFRKGEKYDIIYVNYDEGSVKAYDETEKYLINLQIFKITW